MTTRRTPLKVREALELFELEDSKPLTAADINARFRPLMAKNHPDAGGSKVIAQQLNLARNVLLDWIQAGYPDEEIPQAKKPETPRSPPNQNAYRNTGKQSGQDHREEKGQSRSRSGANAQPHSGSLIALFDWLQDTGRRALQLGLIAVALFIGWQAINRSDTGTTGSTGSTGSTGYRQGSQELPAAVYAGFSPDASRAADHYLNFIIGGILNLETGQPLFDEPTLETIRQEIINFESIDVPAADIDQAVRERNLKDMQGGTRVLQDYGPAFGSFESYMRINAYKAAYGRTLLDLVSTPEMRRFNADYLLHRQYGPIRDILGAFPTVPPHGPAGDDPSAATLCVEMAVRNASLILTNGCAYPVRVSYCYASDFTECEPHRYRLWDEIVQPNVSRRVIYQMYQRQHYLHWFACANPAKPQVGTEFLCVDA
jgi:hypothetical protein